MDLRPIVGGVVGAKEEEKWYGMKAIVRAESMRKVEEIDLRKGIEWDCGAMDYIPIHFLPALQRISIPLNWTTLYLLLTLFTSIAYPSFLPSFLPFPFPRSPLLPYL